MHALALLTLFVSQLSAGAPEEKPVQDPQDPRTVVITAKPLKEESLVGPYKQPEWTTKRRFPSTRVYVQQPPGTVEFEQWVEVRVKKDPGETHETRLREEFEFGLGGRFQLDLYAHTVYNANREDAAESSLDWRGWSAELRYALADWDEIFGNPTLYFEYILFNGSEMAIEPKLLFGGEIAEGWHWGTNLIYERELAGHNDRTEEMAIAASVSRTIIDSYLSVGVTSQFTYEVEAEDGDAERSRELLLGPNIQWRPHRKAHFDIEPMWGLTGESKRFKMYLIFGWDF